MLACSFTQVENDAGKWILVERETMQPFGWINAQACISEDKQELPLEQTSTSDISQDFSISYVKESAAIESASTGEY